MYYPWPLNKCITNKHTGSMSRAATLPKPYYYLNSLKYEIEKKNLRFDSLKN